jgi:spermidine synthase
LTKPVNSKIINETQVNSLGFLFWLKWVGSFIWPITVVKHQSEEEYLELVLFRGSRLLNSRNANYSNGNLQTAYRNLFAEVDLNLSQQKRVLILGFGFGGVAELITQSNPYAHITGVESNTTVLTWYKAYCKQLHNVKLVLQDAKEFMSGDDQRYDLIVCDIYNDMEVPKFFQSSEFIHQLGSRLATSGAVIFNKVVQNREHKNEFNAIFLEMSNVFLNVQVNEQFGLNRFVVAKNRT